MARAPDPPLFVREWRGRVPFLRQAVPLNHCAQAPLVKEVREALERGLTGWCASGADWAAWDEALEGARAGFARLVGAAPGDVALCGSASAAAASVASALDFGGGRKVIVTTEAEFPGVAHAWLGWERRGAEVRRVPGGEEGVEGEEVIAALDERVRLVSVPHSDYRTGALADVAGVARAARERGALSLTDAYQSVGARRVNVEELGVDFLIGGPHKFLLGTPGLAFLYVRPAVAATLEPSVTGWYGREDPLARDPARLDWAPGARRFEVGTPPVLPAIAARAGMAAIAAVGERRVEERLEALGRRLAEGGADRGLRLRGPADSRRRTAITAYRVSDPARTEKALRRLGFVASARGSVLRLAPHFYVHEAEVEAALDALAAVVAQDPARAR